MDDTEMAGIIATVLPIFRALDDKRQQELIVHARQLLDEARRLEAAQFDDDVRPPI